MSQASGLAVPAQLRLADSVEVENGAYEVAGGFVQPLSHGELAALYGAVQN